MDKKVREYQLTKEHKTDKRKAIIFTVISHAILLLLMFFFFNLSAEYPPEPEAGILINFGTTSTGQGDVQPTNETPQEITSPEETPVEETQDTETPTETEPVEQTDPVTDDVETQDTEDAPSISEESKPVEETKPAEETKPVEAEPQPEAKPEPEVDPRALFGGSQGANNNVTSQGNNGESGDQGAENGDPNASNMNGDNSFGLGDSGIGYNLSGRKMVSPPKVKDNSQKVGIVVISIKVDKNGKVIYAKYKSKGSTTTDSELIRLAEKAAYDAKFNSNANAQEEQFGTITFNFKVK